MLERAAQKVASYQGTIELRQMDACQLEFADNTFDTVMTVCTFCSVPKPVVGLRELYRVLDATIRIVILPRAASR